MKSIKFKLLIIAYSIYSSVAFAQQTTIQEAIHQYDYPSAIKLIEKEKPTLELDIQRAKCYKALNDYSSAINILESTIEQYPATIYLCMELADCYNQISSHKKAREYLLKALALSPQNSTILRLLGESYDKENKTDSTEFYYLQVIESNPKDYITIEKLCKSYIKNDELMKCVQLTEHCLESDSTNNTINRLNGVSNCLVGNYPRAIKQLTKSYEVDSTNYDTNYFLGMSYFESKKIYHSIKYLEKAYTKDSTNLNTLYCLGTVFYNYGNFSKSLQLLEQGINILKQKDEMLYKFYMSLSGMYHMAQKYHEEAETLETAYNCNNNKPLLILKIASIYDLAIKNTEKAIFWTELYLKRTNSKSAKYNKDEEIEQNSTSDKYRKDAEKRLKELKELLKKPQKRKAIEAHEILH